MIQVLDQRQTGGGEAAHCIEEGIDERSVVTG